jgi:Hemerythrin HHE cation binding domain
MTPSEIREELLSQHASLRGRLHAARLSVARWARGEAPRILIRTALAELGEALRSHNANEESSLRALILVGDAWGPARVEIMDQGHVDEHAALCDALLSVEYAESPSAGAEQFERFYKRILEHMAREEETFLNAEVVRDGGPATAARASGG